MDLTLKGIEQQVGPARHLYPIDLTLVPRAVTVNGLSNIRASNAAATPSG